MKRRIPAFCKSAFLSCVLAATSLVPVGARANEVLITISGAGDSTTLLYLEQSPIPYYVSGDFFGVVPIAVFSDGFQANDLFGFSSDPSHDSFQDQNDLYHAHGPSLFSGPASSPTFVIGSYTEFNYTGHTDTVTISAIPAVPEPSTWAMMLLGFAGLGFATYRRIISSGRTASAVA
jgi:hypothetical protein